MPADSIVPEPVRLPTLVAAEAALERAVERRQALADDLRKAEQHVANRRAAFDAACETTHRDAIAAAADALAEAEATVDGAKDALLVHQVSEVHLANEHDRQVLQQAQYHLRAIRERFEPLRKAEETADLFRVRMEYAVLISGKADERVSLTQALLDRHRQEVGARRAARIEAIRASALSY